MLKSIPEGAQIYSKPVLFLYDFVVLKFSNTLIWRCPSKLILKMYNQHISANHLDIGVGTGYFLDRCTYPKHPNLALLDINPSTLEVSTKRVSRYQPKTYQADILDPLSHNLPLFDSIAINYLLHCLPGDLISKEIVFKNAKSLLNKNGVIFGATILGDTSQANFLAKKLLGIYNSKKIFSNLNDTLDVLQKLLEKHFKKFELKQEGQVALFSAQI